MGVLISRFRKKPTTVELLQQIQQQIGSIESYKSEVQSRRRRVVYLIVCYSAVFYVLTGLGLYLYHRTHGAVSVLTVAVLLLLLPLVLFLVKNLLVYYYDFKISRNHKKLVALHTKKKSILQDVQEKETYRVAREILEKFAPELLLHSPSRTLSDTKPPSTPVSTVKSGSEGGSQLRRRVVSGSTAVNSPAAGVTPVSTTVTNKNTVSPYDQLRLHRQAMMSSHLSSPSSPAARQQLVYGPALPRPVLSRNRSYLDRVVDMLVGDGPDNRYALVCSVCHSHNGMALKEEFEYLAFRCCYCHGWNPARKQRPTAPPLSSASSSQSLDTDSAAAVPQDSEHPAAEQDVTGVEQDDPARAGGTDQKPVVEGDLTSTLDREHDETESAVVDTEDDILFADQHESGSNIDKMSEDSYEHVEKSSSADEDVTQKTRTERQQSRITDDK